MIEFDPLENAWMEPKRLKEWGKRCTPQLEIPWLSQINFERTPVEFMSVSRFLLPEFITFKDGVFLKMQFSEVGFAQWFDKLDNLDAVEQMINHTHVYDIFGNANDATEEEFEKVAILIQKTWQIALSVTFPDERFDVKMQNSDTDYGPIVTFNKLR